MKCLIIASDIGVTAPGIVYQTLLTEMSKCMDITLITNKISGNLPSGVRVMKSIKRKFKSSTISKKSMAFLGVDIVEYIAARLNLLSMNFEGVDDMDTVISFTSFHNYESLEVANFLSRRYRLKWFIYSVDAIPAPIGWSVDNSYYRNTIKYISKMIEKSDGFFSSNKQMLDYQLSFLKNCPNTTGVLYTPIRNNSIKLNDKTDNITFVYTGSLYGPRKIEVLLSAFKRFVADHPSSKLIFVGKYYFEYSNLLRDLLLSNNVEMHDFATDLVPYYSRATVLIDINAYFDNDVFLSSKIINYLSLYKPIISLTGYNSPARNIFTDDNSILHCQHDENEIYESMIKSIDLKVEASARNIYIEEFSSENVVYKFVNEIS